MSRQVLSFVVGHEEYAIDILRVHEIKSFVPVTPVPNAPSHVRGVMNLRGTVVPVVDLRVRFNASHEDSRTTVIILAAVGGKIVGFVVDGVSDVLDLPPESITPPPGFGGDTSYLQAVARIDERLLGMVDVDAVGSLA